MAGMLKPQRGSHQHMILAHRLYALTLVMSLLLAACGGAPSVPTSDTKTGTQPTTAATVETPSPTTETSATHEEVPASTTVVDQEESPVAGSTQIAAAPTSEPASTETVPTVEATQAPTSEPAAASQPAATAQPAATEEPVAGAAYTGRVTNDVGEPVRQAWVYVGDTIARTNAQGQFTAEAAEGAKTLTVMAPGFKKYTAPLQGNDAGSIQLEPFVAKAVYVSGVGDLSVRSRFYELLDDTELNAIVINVKNDDGRVWTSNVPLARQTEASYPDFNLAEFVKEAHGRGIYVIGRFTTFRDPTLANARLDMAVKHVNGGVWADNQGHNWVDPFNRKVWEYFGDLGEEIAQSGIDEIQFDYVRFPVDGDLSKLTYLKNSTRNNRPPTIKGFLKYMEGRLRPHKVFISADTFGLTVVSDNEQGTGQVLSQLAQHLDYYSPMIYPDHYAAGTFGYSIPSKYPYEVIYESVERAREKLKGTPVLVRPYLSAFKDTQFGQPMGLPQFLAQKKAAEEAGAVGWIFWNAGLTYPDELFRAE